MAKKRKGKQTRKGSARRASVSRGRSKPLKRKNKRSVTGEQTTDSATLYARVKEPNKDFIAKLAGRCGVSECLLVDTLLDELRTHGEVQCSSLEKVFKSA